MFLKRTQGIDLGHISEPAVITDQHGRVILWYLPNLMTSDQQVYLYTALIICNLMNIKDYLLSITKPMVSCLQKPKLDNKNKSWRNNITNFLQVEGQTYSPGVDTFAAGWLPQGHAVSLITYEFMYY
jgi:hypothetical protein